MKQFIKRSALLLFLTAGVYFCYLISGIYHQKMYIFDQCRLKKPYKHIHNERYAYFTQVLTFSMFPPLFAALIGKAALLFQKQRKQLPPGKCMMISGIVNVNLFTFNQAVIHASFPAVVMVKSCSLLSVVIVGVFFSRVTDAKLKLTHKKLLIGLLATVGIIMFNLSKKVQNQANNKPLQLLSIGNIFLIISLIGDGFLPDFQAQLKSQHKPSTMLMYYEVNKYTFLMSLTAALIFNRFTTILAFLYHFQDFASDMIHLSLLNAVGQLFVYRMIKQFRQHVPALVIAFRKCLTVIVNIVWYRHIVNKDQLMGMAIVFIAIFWEVYCSYQESLEKEKSKQIQFIEYQVQGNQPNEQANRLIDAIEEEIKIKQTITQSQDQKNQKQIVKI